MKPSRRWTTVPVFLLMLLISECGYSPRTSNRTFFTSLSEIPVTGPDVPGIEQYDEAIKALMVEWKLPGLTLAVARDGKLIVARGYGYADYDAKQPMQPYSRMRIASASKTFTAAAILHLVEMGKLDLDDRWLDILTQYQLPPNADQRLRSVTIRQLLQHSGGWDRDINRERSPSEISSALGISGRVRCSQTITYMLTQKLEFGPGERFAYSNFGYCILGRVIEKLTGKLYEDYIRGVVLEPMAIRGMTIGHTLLSQRGPDEVRYYDFPGALYSRSVLPGGGLVERPYGAFAVETGDASGGWVASSIDLTRFMTAMDGTRQRFLSAAMLAEFTAKPNLKVTSTNPAWNGTPRTDGWYGAGIFVQPDIQDLTWWHWGNMAGTDSVMLRNGRGYAWASITNTMPQNTGGFMVALDRVLWDGFNAGIAGSATDLYAQFPSREVPASDNPN